MYILNDISVYENFLLLREKQHPVFGNSNDLFYGWNNLNLQEKGECGKNFVVEDLQGIFQNIIVEKSSSKEDVEEKIITGEIKPQHGGEREEGAIYMLTFKQNLV
jgi:hypothetical protein